MRGQVHRRTCRHTSRHLEGMDGYAPIGVLPISACGTCTNACVPLCAWAINKQTGLGTTAPERKAVFGTFLLVTALALIQVLYLFRRAGPAMLSHDGGAQVVHL